MRIGGKNSMLQQIDDNEHIHESVEKANMLIFSLTLTVQVNMLFTLWNAYYGR